ncbi:MAG: metallophosphoesterase family protein [Verrucomicrobiaceae bacterium]|nr:metallophosphoesterase family protein [Verrucomicrobiaceae bacterium]
MKHHLTLIAPLVTLLLIAAAPDGKPKGEGKGGGKGGAGAGGQVEPAVVPPYLFNVWLCRPGADSVTVSVLAWEDMDAFIEYGSPPQSTAAMKLKAGAPQNVVLEGLKPDTTYNYRLTYRRAGGGTVQDVMRSFHTQRKPGTSFRFVMQADSHLDNNTDVRVYQQTLANMLADKPDFMIDLGDTTMVDKFGQFFRRSESQYKAQRYYMGSIAHSVPIFMVLGNHDGERGERLDMAEWSLGMRHAYFPNPADGNDKHSYFAFEWGNALIIGLDPFWATTERGASGWGMTLGETQYRWLAKTLAGSKATLRFVFIHHLVGGLGRDARGGAKTAALMEWGGRNADGSEGFRQNRPGWETPIHQLLVKNHVNVVFHGHDHLFVKEELDGIIYQEVPQPGHPSGGTRSAEEYGYSGVILGSSGHLRVSVEANDAKVDYVRSIVPGVTRADTENGTVEHSYSVRPR